MTQVIYDFLDLWPCFAPALGVQDARFYHATFRLNRQGGMAPDYLSRASSTALFVILPTFVAPGIGFSGS